jgi:FMN phosphatase YigB (HAD superfamily)
LGKLKKKKYKKVLCFDIDNTICKTKGNNYIKAVPIKLAIRKINELYDNGYYIKLFTSRFMGRNEEKILKAKKQGYKITLNQLKNWNIKYHKLILGKPSYDLFIDDRSIYFKKNWYLDIHKFL